VEKFAHAEGVSANSDTVEREPTPSHSASIASEPDRVKGAVNAGEAAPNGREAVRKPTLHRLNTVAPQHASSTPLECADTP
jgi:hypothetical protein